jgi:translation initiation factor 2 beta subunit (eIF-2beta)/eIF-5
VGLFNRKPIYISDRGDQFTVEEMEPSHLMNAINHHRTQIDNLDWILENSNKDKDDNTNIHLRRIALFSTVEALVKELRTRDPDEDHDFD